MAKVVIEFEILKGHLETMREGAMYQRFGRVPNREPASYSLRGFARKDGSLKFELEIESGDNAEDVPLAKV